MTKKVTYDQTTISTEDNQQGLIKKKKLFVTPKRMFQQSKTPAPRPLKESPQKTEEKHKPQRKLNLTFRGVWRIPNNEFLELRFLRKLIPPLVW